MSTINVPGIIYDDLFLDQTFTVSNPFGASNLQASSVAEDQGDGTIKVTTTITYDSVVPLANDSTSQDFSYDSASDQNNTIVIQQEPLGPPVIILSPFSSSPIVLTPFNN